MALSSRIITNAITRLSKGDKLSKAQKDLFSLNVETTKTGRYKFKALEGAPREKGPGFKTEEALFQTLKEMSPVQLRTRLEYGVRRKEGLQRIKNLQAKAKQTQAEKAVSKEAEYDKIIKGKSPGVQVQVKDSAKTKAKEKKLTNQEIANIYKKQQEEDFLSRVTTEEYRSRGGRNLIERAVESGVAKDRKSVTTLEDVYAYHPDTNQMFPVRKTSMRDGGVSVDGKRYSSEELATKVRLAEAEQGIDVAKNKEFYAHAERMGFSREKVDDFLSTMGYKPEEAYTVMTHVPGKGTPMLDDAGKIRMTKDNKPMVRTKGRKESIVFRHADPAKNIITKKTKEGEEVRKEVYSQFNKVEQMEKRTTTQKQINEKRIEKEKRQIERKAVAERNMNARRNAQVVDEVKAEKKKGPGSEQTVSTTSQASKATEKVENQEYNFFNSEFFRQDSISERVMQGSFAGAAAGGITSLAQGNIPLLGEDGDTVRFMKSVGAGMVAGGAVGGATKPLLKAGFTGEGIGVGALHATNTFHRANPDSIFADTAKNLGGMKKYFIGPESQAQKAASQLTKADRALMYSGAGLTSGIASSYFGSKDNRSRGLNSNRGNRF